MDLRNYVERLMRQAYLDMVELDARWAKETDEAYDYCDEIMWPKVDAACAALSRIELHWPAEWRSTLRAWCSTQRRANLRGAVFTFADMQVRDRALDQFGLLLGIDGAEARFDRNERARIERRALQAERVFAARTRAAHLVDTFLGRPGDDVSAIEMVFGEADPSCTSRNRADVDAFLVKEGMATVIASLALDDDDPLHAALHAAGRAMSEMTRCQDRAELEAGAIMLQRAVQDVADALCPPATTLH